MFARIRKSMKERDEGFTLIELLVVMIIIGILAAIAIPVFLNQRKKAAETAAKSDAANISTEVAAFLVDGNPATITIAVTTAPTYTLTTTTPADSTTVKASTGDTPTMTYTSTTGAYCVTVTPTYTGASAWSAGNNGLQKGTTCPA